MAPRIAVILVLAALPALCEDWSPRLAAQYLDARQKEWFAWPQAKSQGGPCFSCHTGATYLLARADLRRALGESQPTAWETGLWDSLRARVDKDQKQLYPTQKETYGAQGMGVEAIFSTLFLTLKDSASTTLSADAKQAFDRLWSLQIRDGKAAGAWAWFELNRDPWETPDSPFYGAALAAMAVGSAPAEYRNQPGIREYVTALTGYLQREQQTQPLHNRLILLWATSKLPSALPEPLRRPIVDEVLRKQQPDGGWTVESLGPWKPRPEAPTATGSSSYATGFVAVVLQKAGVARSHPGLMKSLAWLKAHQDRESGAWPADSMNKRYEADSMPLRFMQDAATAYATLALLEAR